MIDFIKHRKKKHTAGKASMPAFDPVNSQDLYDKRNDFSVSAKNFLYKPAGFILKGPVFIIFLFLFAALIYSFIGRVETKVNSSVSIVGEKYIIQSPVLGTVNSILVEESRQIDAQQDVITLLSESELASKENIGELRDRLKTQIRKFKEIKFAIKKIKDLVAYYKVKNPDFSIESTGISADGPSELQSESHSLLSDSVWEESDYYNIVQKTSVNLTELWAGFQRSKELLQKQEKIYKEDQKLFEREVLTEYQIAESHQKYLSLKAQTENYINSFKIEVYNILQEFLDIKNSIVENYKELKNTVRHSEMLGEEIVINDKVVMIKSKYSGVVTDINVRNYEYVDRGMQLFAVIRDDLPKTGITYITDQSIGKVKIGQLVFIKFSAYPYQEYGIQKGRITDISAEAEMVEGAGLVYQAEVAFEEINPRINLKYGMQGNAEIATGEKRMIELIFEPMTKVFNYIEGVSGSE